MGEHAYVSTACQHQLHQQCRRTCKFCPADCGCMCHIRDELAAAVVREQHRLALREHALYCSTVMFNGWLIASGGTRPDSAEVIEMAEVFVEWLNTRPEGVAAQRREQGEPPKAVDHG